jgi:uncharacterized tellurite resistance protein B-like protein
MEQLRRLFNKVIGDESVKDVVASTDGVRSILQELQDLPVEHARYVAAFAYVLGRAAQADHETSDEEIQRMQEILRRIGGLQPETAALAVRAAVHRNELFGATDDFIVTREFRDMSTLKQRQELVNGAFAITAADDSISSKEEAAVRQIAAELGFSDPEYLGMRAKWNNKRDVLKNWPSPRNNADQE